jgi:hypothetical protein
MRPSELEKELERLEQKYIRKRNQVPFTKKYINEIITAAAVVGAGMIFCSGLYFGSQFIPVNTPEPTLQPTLQPTPTEFVYEGDVLPAFQPMPEMRYQVVSIESVSELSHPDNKLGGPLGIIEFNSIPFVNGWQATTQCSHFPDFSEYIVLPVSIENPQNVYVWLQAGYGLERYTGKQVGSIVLGFESAAVLQHDLYLDVNIRDWKKGKNLIEIAIPDDELYNRLTSVEIHDFSNTTTGSVDPCVHLLAATVGHYVQEIAEPADAILLEQPPIAEQPTQPQAAQSPQPTPQPFVQLWNQNLTWRSRIGQGYSETETLRPGEVLYVSAGEIRVGNQNCYRSEDQLCVYIKEAKGNETVVIENLIPGHSWIAVAEAGAYTALRDRTPTFWLSPNCGDGCDVARVVMERSEGSVEKFLVYPNGDTHFLGKTNQPNLETYVSGIHYPEEQSIVYTGWKRAMQAQQPNQAVTLEQGDVLYISATQFEVDGVGCYGKYPIVCVYMREATGKETLTLENLVPGQTWIAVTDMSIYEVYESRKPAFWIAPNCGHGCSQAIIHAVKADGTTENFTLYR